MSGSRSVVGRIRNRTKAAPRYAAALVVALAVAAVTLVPSTASAAGALTMTSFSPPSGPVGTVVTIHGSGFVAGDVVQFNGTKSNAVTVNPAGTVLLAAVPALATSGPITVTDPTTGQTVGLPGTVFQVTLGMTAAPRQVWAGGRLIVAGSGLPPGEAGSLMIGSTRLANVTFNRNGDFALGLTLSFELSPGQKQLILVYPGNQIVTVIFVLGAWPMYRHDPQHTGDDTYETAFTVNDISALGEAWMKQTDAAATWVIPSVANGLVYETAADPATSPHSTSAYAFTTDGKKETWTTGYYTTVESEPAIDNGSEYLTALGGLQPEAYSLAAATGSQNWYTSLPDLQSVHLTAPDVIGGYLFTGGSDGTMYALNASTGKVVWSYPTGSAIYSAPAFLAGDVFFGNEAGTFYALNAVTGAKVWSVSGWGPIDSSPAAQAGVVYFGSDSGIVAALKTSNGAQVWKDTFPSQPFVTGSPAIANGLVYVGANSSTDGELYALNATTGKQAWADPVTGGLSDPAYANGLIFYSSYSAGEVRAADASNGNSLWKSVLVTAPLAPIVSNGTLYVEGKNTIWAFTLQHQ